MLDLKKPFRELKWCDSHGLANHRVTFGVSMGASSFEISSDRTNSAGTSRTGAEFRVLKLANRNDAVCIETEVVNYTRSGQRRCMWHSFGMPKEAAVAFAKAILEAAEDDAAN